MALFTCTGSSNGAMCPHAGITTNSAAGMARAICSISVTVEITSCCPHTTSVGTVMAGNQGVASSRCAMPRSAAATPAGRADRITCSVAVITAESLPLSTFGKQLWHHRIDQHSRPFRQHSIGRLQSRLGHFGSVGSGSRVTKNQMRQSRGMPPPELPGDVATHRQAAQGHGLIDLQHIK